MIYVAYTVVHFFAWNNLLKVCAQCTLILSTETWQHAMLHPATTQTWIAAEDHWTQTRSRWTAKRTPSASTRIRKRPSLTRTAHSSDSTAVRKTDPQHLLWPITPSSEFTCEYSSYRLPSIDPPSDRPTDHPPIVCPCIWYCYSPYWNDVE